LEIERQAGFAGGCAFHDRFHYSTFFILEHAAFEKSTKTPEQQLILPEVLGKPGAREP
jgi:hypothetical protein